VDEVEPTTEKAIQRRRLLKGAATVAGATPVYLAMTASPARADTPSGPAGGVLSGEYPDPGFAEDMATQAELDAVAARKTSIVVAADGTGDFSTIKAALAAVPPSGAEVFVKRGVYVEDNVVVPSNTTLRGEGDATVVRLPDNTNSNVLRAISPSSDVVIRDLKVDGNKSNQGSFSNNGIQITATRVKVMNVHVVNASGYNIVGMNGATDLLVQGCVSEDAAKEGIEYMGVQRGAIIGNLVRNAGNHGIYVWSNSGGSGGGTLSEEIVVAGNVVTDAGAAGPGFSGIRIDDKATNVTVTGNVVKGSSDNGIFATGNPQAVTGISIADNLVTGPVNHGIQVAYAQSVAVSGNTIKDQGGDGIRISAPATDVTVSGNHVTGAPGKFGILVAGAARVAVSANNCRGAGRAGIATSNPGTGGATDVDISGNVCSGNGEAGISVGSGSGIVCSANRCLSNGHAGIETLSSKDVAVSANVCSMNGRSGVLIFTSTNCTIIGNICRSNGQDQAQTNHVNGITLWSSGGTVANCTVIGNRCYDDQTTKTQRYGIRALNAVDNCTFGQNLVEGNATTGLSFSAAPTGGTTSVPYRKLENKTVGASQTAIPHGLPYVPQSIQILMTTTGSIWRSAASDATNIYLTADKAGRTADILVG
jgi:parallel beta-helix repeat protein